MPGKTVGELMEEMRIKAGAKEYHGHSYMDLQRFADDTRHMIILMFSRMIRLWVGKASEPGCIFPRPVMRRLWRVSKRSD